jgi:hypothetical protein
VRLSALKAMLDWRGGAEVGAGGKGKLERGN